MTAEIYNMRDYKTPEERYRQTYRLLLVSITNPRGPTNRELFEIEAGNQAHCWPDSGDCA